VVIVFVTLIAVAVVVQKLLQLSLQFLMFVAALLTDSQFAAALKMCRNVLHYLHRLEI